MIFTNEAAVNENHQRIALRDQHIFINNKPYHIQFLTHHNMLSIDTTPMKTIINSSSDHYCQGWHFLTQKWQHSNEGLPLESTDSQSLSFVPCRPTRPDTQPLHASIEGDLVEPGRIGLLQLSEFSRGKTTWISNASSINFTRKKLCFHNKGLICALNISTVCVHIYIWSIKYSLWK